MHTHIYGQPNFSLGEACITVVLHMYYRYMIYMCNIPKNITDVLCVSHM